MHPLTGAQDHSYPASANNKQARTTLNKPYSLDVDRRWQVMLGVGSVKGLWPDSVPTRTITRPLRGNVDTGLTFIDGEIAPITGELRAVDGHPCVLLSMVSAAFLS